MSRRNNTNAVLGAIAIFSICILLVIIAWHYIIEGGAVKANASGDVQEVEASGEDAVYRDISTDVQKETDAEYSPEIQNEQTKPDIQNTGEYQYSQIVTEFVTRENNTEENVDTSLEQKYIIMNPLMQKPSLPTGCEITSLTSVLNYWGYNVTKETMADKYLEKGELGKVTAFEAFIGDPATNDGYGCFAPVIKRAANKYLSEQNSFYRAYDISGTSFEDLYKEINQNHPVIVWATINMSEPRYYEQWKLEDGTYSWVGGGHCLVITGYNKTENIVYVMDPLSGNVKYDASLFKTRYEQLFSQAVVIK